MPTYRLKEKMDQVENQGQEQEIVQTDIAPPEMKDQQDSAAQQEESPKQKSWISQLRRERDEALRENRMQKELLQRVMTQQPPQAPVNPQPKDLLSELAKEEYVPGTKVAEALQHVEQRFESKLKSIEQSYAQTAWNAKIDRLKQKYSDLDDVVNLETLEILRETDPEAAEVLKGKDDYTIYVMAYPLIKNSGILDQVKGVRRAKEVDTKIEQNKKTVPSPQSFDKRPMAQAFNYERLSQEQKNALFNEMNQYASLASGAKPL